MFHERCRARAPTNGPSRCLIVPSGLATRSTGERDANAWIVLPSSDTRGVTGKIVNYFCPVVKGAEKQVKKRGFPRLPSSKKTAIRGLYAEGADYGRRSWPCSYPPRGSRFPGGVSPPGFLQ